MPRTADHDARRAQICDGVRASAHQLGLVSVTMSSAARSAGVSVGLVQHYYNSKEALLVDTLDRVLADILGRVEHATARAESRNARIEHMVGAGIEELLPIDRTRRIEARLRLSFAGLALDHEEFREHQARFASVLRQRAARAIENACECGEIPEPDAIDPQREAMALLSLADGLCLQLLTSSEPDDVDRAREVIATRMSALFRGACSHRR